MKNAKKSWVSMRRRCRHDPRYSNTKICERWSKFENFLADMGERAAHESLDRIDNDGHYTPDNCRWADRTTQNNNRSKHRLVTHNGQTKTLAQWAALSPVSKGAFYQRIRKGWKMEDALRTPRSDSVTVNKLTN